MEVADRVGALAEPEPLHRFVFDALGVRGEVVSVDRFGNLVTNVAEDHLGEWGVGDLAALTRAKRCWPTRTGGGA